MKLWIKVTTLKKENTIHWPGCFISITSNGLLEWFCILNSLLSLLPGNLCPNQSGPFICPWLCHKYSHHHAFTYDSLLSPSSSFSGQTLLWNSTPESPVFETFSTGPALKSHSLCWVPAGLAWPPGWWPFCTITIIICVEVSCLIICTGNLIEEEAMPDAWYSFQKYSIIQGSQAIFVIIDER